MNRKYLILPESQEKIGACEKDTEASDGVSMGQIEDNMNIKVNNGYQITTYLTK